MRHLSAHRSSIKRNGRLRLRSATSLISMRNFVALAFLALVVSGSAIFAIWRQQPRPVLIPKSYAIPSSYFGMTLHNYNTTTPWPSIPFAALRTWDTAVNWADIQTDPNTYVWSNLDALINLAQKRGVDLVFTLGRTPRWASASPDTKTPYGPGQCAPPSDMRYWDEFLRAVLNHAGGKIKFWETWNEPQSPDSEFYCGDVPTMVELQRRAYEIIKALDPAAMVLTPAPVGGYGPSWMSRFLAAGGGKYADVMAFHGYLPPSAKPESILATIADFKTAFANRGQEQKPVWDTEAGWGQNPWLSDPDLQAAFLAKFYLLHWSAGVERLYWYAYDNKLWGTLWDTQNGLHPAGIAYREVNRWLQGATMTAPCALSRALWTCHLIREHGYRGAVLWSSEAFVDTSRVPLPDDYRQYRDLEGNLHVTIDKSIRVSNKPLLFETAPAF
jgi:polysaccharide biosynthesis protein PslG